MPRGGKNHAQGGKNFRARRTVYFFPPPWPILVVRPCPPLRLKNIEKIEYEVHFISQRKERDENIKYFLVFHLSPFPIQENMNK